MKKFKIPTPLLSLFVVISLILLLVWFWILFDYISIRSSLVNLSSKKEEYSDQEQRVKKYKSQLNFIDFQLQRVKELNHKLRILTRLEIKKNRGTAEQQLLNRLKRKESKGILSIIKVQNANFKLGGQNRKNKLVELKKFLMEETVFYHNIPTSWPVKGLLISGFGYRSDPLSGQLRPHHGVDIATKLDSPIYSPANGIIIQMKRDEYLGNIIFLRHNKDLVTKYAHVTTPFVKEGQIVKKGQLMAKVGNTGKSAGSHLHYEVIFHEIPQNPINYIQSDE